MKRLPLMSECAKSVHRVCTAGCVPLSPSRAHTQLLSCVWLFVTLWTAVLQVPVSMGFSRQEYWSGLPCLPQGIFLTQGSNSHLLRLLHWQADFFTPEPPEKPATQPHWAPNGDSERPWSQAARPLTGYATLGKLLNHPVPQLFYPQHGDRSVSSNLPRRTVVRISKI